MELTLLIILSIFGILFFAVLLLICLFLVAMWIINWWIDEVKGKKENK